MPDLFSPGAIGGVSIRNRLVMPPVNTNYGDAEGFVTDRAISFIRKRAAGGVGAIILEATQVDPASKIVAREMGAYDDLFIPGLARMADAIHAEGAAAFIQLNHGGPKAAFDLNGVQCVSASAIPVKKHNMPRAAGDRARSPRVVQPARRGGAAGPAGRLRRRGAAGLPLLPAERLHVGLPEPPHRRLWRQRGESLPLVTWR